MVDVLKENNLNQTQMIMLHVNVTPQKSNIIPMTDPWDNCTFT